MRPGKRAVRWAVAALIALAAQDREIGRFLSPRRTAVRGRRRIEHAQRAALGIEQLNAVAGFIFGCDRDCQQTTFVLPREFGDVTERRVATSGELTDDEGRARRSFVLGCRRTV